MDPKETSPGLHRRSLFGHADPTTQRAFVAVN